MDMENVFSGTICHQLDDKGRVRIPSKFFPKTADKPDDEKRDFTMRFYFMAGAHGCISVYLKEALDARINEMLSTVETTEENKVRARRKILGSIEPVMTDKQGRAVIPTFLRNNAKIGRELVSVGVGDHFEIWSKEEYERQDSSMSYDMAYREVGFF